MANIYFTILIFLCVPKVWAIGRDELQCLGLPEMDMTLFAEIREVAEEDPDAIVVVASSSDPCSLSYLARTFSATNLTVDFISPVNARSGPAAYEYICPNGRPYDGRNSCPQVDFNVGILNGSQTQLRPSPDGQGIVLGLTDADYCITDNGTRLQSCLEYNSPVHETGRRQVVVPFTSIEDAQGKQVSLPCSPTNCRGIVFRGREGLPSDSLLTITTNEDGSQTTRLIVNTDGYSGIIFESGKSINYRSCRRPRGRR